MAHDQKTFNNIESFYTWQFTVKEALQHASYAQHFSLLRWHDLTKIGFVRLEKIQIYTRKNLTMTRHLQ